MKLIDTHSHMYLPGFDEDRSECMERARKNGVLLTLLPNIDTGTIKDLRTMIRQYPEQCRGMMGLHPCSVKDDFEDQLAVLKKELESNDYVAVGEIGIDLYWDKSTLEIQIEAFEEQIKWAKEKGLPIVIHGRDSFTEIFGVLDRLYEKGLSGVFHCFTGSVREAEKALSYPGFFLGIGGVVTFKNSGLGELVKELGLERIVLETDAPYLTPHPFRGKRNETSHTRIIAEKLAQIFDISLMEVSKITSRNAEELFKINENC